LLRALLVVVALAAGAGIAVAIGSTGGLDPSFGTGGTTVFTEHETDTYPVSDAIAPGGRTIVLSTPEPGKLVVQRLLADGRPDLSLDGTGEAVIKTPGFPGGHAVAVQPDGKIVVVGYSNVESKEAATVWRLNPEIGSGAPNGDLDTTFGNAGVVELETREFNDAQAVTLQPDGKILVAGGSRDMGSDESAAVWRLTADGGLDIGFNGTGAKIISDTSEDSVTAVAVGPEGKIVLAGATGLSVNPPDAVAWRVDANGETDTTFDGDGQADIDTGGADLATAVAIQPDGKIVLAGRRSKTGEPEQARVWRMTATGGSGTTNGALDPTFANEGTAILTGSGFAEASALALQPDGKVLVAGSTNSAGTPPFLAAVWRLLPEGGSAAPNSQLDPTFGKGGITTVAEGEGAFVNSIALAPDRRVVASGATYTDDVLVFRTLGEPFALSVSRTGTGSGTVSSSPAAIACGATCAASLDDGSQLVLSATPASGSVFAGWSGGSCSGTGACAVTASSDQAVTARFELAQACLCASIGTQQQLLANAKLRAAKLKRGAKHFVMALSGLRAGTKLSASLLAGRSVLARANATAGAKGNATLTFKFSKKTRRRLHRDKLKKLQVQISATLGAQHAKLLRTVKLAG
jgi:uncharacterized delta-60 repeat protein